MLADLHPPPPVASPTTIRFSLIVGHLLPDPGARILTPISPKPRPMHPSESRSGKLNSSWSRGRQSWNDERGSLSESRRWLRSRPGDRKKLQKRQSEGDKQRKLPRTKKLSLLNRSDPSSTSRRKSQRSWSPWPVPSNVPTIWSTRAE